MVENSTINEIIKGISALIGGAFGVKILDYFIQRKKKKEEKKKEVLISSLIGISLIVALMVLVPTAGEWIKTVTGFEIKQPIDNGGAVFLGAIIYDQVRKSIKPKQPKE